MRVAAFLLMVVPVIALAADADTKPLSQDEKGLRWKEKRLAELGAELKELEGKVSEFKRSRQFVEVNKVDKEIRDLKKTILGVRKMTTQEAFLNYEKEQSALAEEQRKKAAAQEMAEAERKRKANNTERPLVIAAIGIVENSIGIPELVVDVANDCAQGIEAFTIDGELFNKFNEPVNFGRDQNRFSCISQASIPVGATQRCRHTLVLRDTATRADIWISRIKFADGSEWKQDKETAKTRPGNIAAARMNK